MVMIMLAWITPSCISFLPIFLEWYTTEEYLRYKVIIAWIWLVLQVTAAKYFLALSEVQSSNLSDFVYLHWLISELQFSNSKWFMFISTDLFGRAATLTSAGS